VTIKEILIKNPVYSALFGVSVYRKEKSS